MSVEKSKIMIFGGSGYLGRYMVKASVSLGHPTFVYARPLDPHNPTSKSLLLKEFESMGVTIFYGEPDEHEKLVSVLKQVEVVISTLAVPQHLDQIKVIRAIKDAGTIKLNMHDVVVFNYEEDVAAYTVKAATDPRAADRVIIYRPPENITSQSELISTWEKKTGRTLKRVYVPEEELVKLSETLPFPENIPVAVLHNIFIKGDQLKYELKEEDLEASMDTSIDKYFDMCLVDPPQPKLAAFA